MVDNPAYLGLEEQYFQGEKIYNYGGFIPQILVQPAPPPSASPTPSITPTITPTNTSTSTPTPTPTFTPTNTQTNTPTPSITPSPSSISFDVDAAAYLNDVIVAGGTLSPTISAATDTLFVSLKNNGLYTKMYAFYPMLGGVSSSNALNGIRDNFLYDLTWNGGFTYNSSGATANGTDGWANTNFLTNQFLLNNFSFGFYQYTSNTPTKTEEIIMGQSFGGTEPELQIGTRFGGAGLNRFFRCGGASSITTSAGGNYKGFYVGSRSSSTQGFLYRNGNTTPILTITNTYSIGTGKPVAVWNFYQNTGVYSNGYSNQGLSFIFLGEGLSSAEVATFSNIVNTFQTALGRNTY